MSTAQPPRDGKSARAPSTNQSGAEHGAADRIDEVPSLRGYLCFDPTAPYLVREPLPMYFTDMGPWPDLAPSHVDVAGVYLGDGPTRELLHRFRIGKEQWLAVTAEDRQTIKAALAQVFQLQNAVHDLVDPEAPETTRRRARAFVGSMAKTVEQSVADRRGHPLESARRFAVPIGHALFVAVRRELQRTRVECQRARNDLRGSKQGIEEWVTAVNREFKRKRLAPVCTAKDVSMVIGKGAARGASTPAAIAATLVQRAMPVLSKDDIRRGQPRRRR